MAVTMICFTCDIEWAPEELINDTLGIFKKYGVKCTFFATHASKVLKSYDEELFEVGIHPNFNTLFDDKNSIKSTGEIIDDLLLHYPSAIGVRSHGLTSSTKLIALFKEKRLKYDSNLFLPYFKGLRAFDIMDGWVRIPYNWEDDTHFHYGYPFNSTRLFFGKNSFNIMNFHPIHIYLNTDSNLTYINAKAYYQDTIALKRFINRGNKKGVRDLLLYTLEKVVYQKRKTYKLSDLL